MGTQRWEVTVRLGTATKRGPAEMLALAMGLEGWEGLRYTELGVGATLLLTGIGQEQSGPCRGPAVEEGPRGLHPQ